MREHDIYRLIAQYLQVKYPDVIYRFDLAADLKLTIGQARKHKTLHPHRGYPDLFIAEIRPHWGDISFNTEYHGLYLEIKKDGTRLKKKNGEWATPHIAEQAEMLEKLEKRGYWAEFAVGIDEALEIIDEYLGRRKKEV